jgi:hypothetical protein
MQGKQANTKWNKNILDPSFDIEEEYFFKQLSSGEWTSIRNWLGDFISNGKTDGSLVKSFFAKYPSLRKGGDNVSALRKLVDEVAESQKSEENFFSSYLAINEVISTEYMIPRPTVLECFFFPSETNEDKVVNMMRTCKKCLDIAIFTLTNDKIFAAVEEVWNNGLNVRIITDDECCKQLGSDIYRLAAVVISCIYINREYQSKQMITKCRICIISSVSLMKLLLSQDPSIGLLRLLKAIKRILSLSKTKM